MTRPRLFSCLPLLLLATPLVLAQQPAPASPPPPPSSPGAPGRQARNVERRIVINQGPRGLEDGGMMHIVPPGTWWKNPDLIAKLGLSADQQKKMDDIFRQNRIQLVDVKATLEKEQINLEPLLNANPMDSAKALAEISRIADLRADLEKANAKMLLALRSVLTADQWSKLQAEQHSRREGMNGLMEHRGMGMGMGMGAGAGRDHPAADGTHPHGPNGPGIE